MASIEFLTERIEGAKAKIEKKQNTIEKKLKLIDKKYAMIEKTEDEQERRWIEFDIKYLNQDIERGRKEIAELRESLDKYIAQKNTVLEKAASRNVKAIIDFLENWKRRMFNYYNMGLEPCYKMKDELKALSLNLRNFRYCTPEYEEALKPYNALRDEYEEKVCGIWEEVEYINRWGKPDKKRVQVQEGEWEYLRPYDCQDSYEQATAKLNADLRDEANRKYDFIIERVNAICGKITDASGLSVGAKGDLNGNIIGERGVAHVQTIGAGGYNIQCFHFRTLIHEVK